jgi:hypothetical protein
MKLAILDTYYINFLSSFYSINEDLKNKKYVDQLQFLLDQVFGTSDFYSEYLIEMGHEAVDIIANCFPLQKSWAKENLVNHKCYRPKFFEWLSRNRFISRLTSSHSGLSQIAIEQIKKERPDVIYCQDLWFLTPSELKQIRPYVKLIVGQTASPLPHESYLKSYDLILTSFPHFVSRIRSLGIPSEYFKIGFDERILDLLGDVKKDITTSFVGGLSRHHRNALMLLEHLARNVDIKFFGYGQDSLSKSSSIYPNHFGEVWGLDMYRCLARSRITFNRHIKVAENYANNMRLYEATGVGAMLITDYKDNLGEIFEIGKEVVAYRNKDEAVDLIRYYASHPEEASKIARAGQMRTLKDHTYKSRMVELIPILEKYMSL